MAAVVAGIIFSFPTTAKLQQDVDAEYPTAALDFMQQQHLRGRTFNADWWGGYMEWNAPDLKPFVDGRADIFVYNGSFDDHHSAGLIKQPFEFLDKYHIEYVLLEPKRPLIYLLEHSPAWRLIYSDKVAVLLERTAPSVTLPN